MGDVGATVAVALSIDTINDKCAQKAHLSFMVSWSFLIVTLDNRKGYRYFWTTVRVVATVCGNFGKNSAISSEKHPKSLPE